MVNKLADESFAEFVQIGQRITDYSAAEEEAVEDNVDDELGVAVVFDEDEEEEDSDLDEIRDASDEDEETESEQEEDDHPMRSEADAAAMALRNTARDVVLTMSEETRSRAGPPDLLVQRNVPCHLCGRKPVQQRLISASCTA